MIIDIGNVIKKIPNKIKKITPSYLSSLLIFVEDANIIIGIKKGITIINWINLFLLICKENSADIKDNNTNVGDDNKKINKILRVDEKFFPKNKEVSGIKKKFANTIDKNIDKLLAINIFSAENPRNWSSFRHPFLKSSSTKFSEVKTNENKIIMNKIGK